MTAENETRLLNEALLTAILHAREWQKRMGYVSRSAQLAAWEALAVARGVDVPPQVRRGEGGTLRTVPPEHAWK